MPGEQPSGENENRIQEEKTVEERAFRRKVVMTSFICCLLVIWNHSGNADLFLPGTGPETWLYRFEYEWAYALVRLDIPFFMTISGYLFFRDMSWEKLPGKWKRRVRSLLVPYLLWNLIWYMAEVCASWVPGLNGLLGKYYLRPDLGGIFRAAVFFESNPVFWFMFQLILLVILAPVLWFFLKRKWTAVLFAAFLGILWWFWPPVPVLNTDGLIYYYAGAFWAVHGRSLAEKGWSRRRALAGAGIVLLGAAIYQIHLRTLLPQPLVLYLMILPWGIWLLMDERRIPEPKRYMKETFFIYATHFYVVRLIGKLAAIPFQGSAAAGALLYILMPVPAVFICHMLARILGKISPRALAVLNGGRS
ncbi:MAG: acyltransferase [Clostridium sp.]|nr:acyltransferase [Clostridium sp.]